MKFNPKSTLTCLKSSCEVCNFVNNVIPCKECREDPQLRNKNIEQFLKKKEFGQLNMSEKECNLCEFIKENTAVEVKIGD